MVPASWHWPFSKLNLSKALAHMMKVHFVAFCKLLELPYEPFEKYCWDLAKYTPFISRKRNFFRNTEDLNLSLRFIPGVMKNSGRFFPALSGKEWYNPTAREWVIDLYRSNGILKIFLNWWLDSLLNPRSHFSNFSLETMICVSLIIWQLSANLKPPGCKVRFLGCIFVN